MRSNEPPCLTQNEPPCLVHHACVTNLFFPSPCPPKKNIIIITTHKCVQTSPRVSRRTSPRVSCIIICMRHGSFFFFPLPLPKKKIIIITKVRSNEPPCLVHHACVTNLFFPSPCSQKKKIIATHKCVQTSPRVSCIVICMRHESFFFFPLPLPKKKIIIITKVRSNEPPCLVQNEPPCLVHHACVTNLFFPSPGPPKKKKKIATHKCVQTSPRVSRRTSPRVSCIVICMRHGSFFFSPLSPAQKKNNHHRKSAFKRAPVSHAERAPVSRASSYACVTNLFFFPPVPCPKKNKSSSSQKCVQTSPRVSRRTSPRVSCIIICMRHGSFFFPPCPLPKKK